MTIATHDDVIRVFPGIQDHAILEILAMNATVNELEAALVLLTSDDKELLDIQHREGDQIHRLMNILNRSQIWPQDDRDE